MAAELDEIVQFLASPSGEVRLEAVKLVAGLSTQPAAQQYFETKAQQQALMQIEALTRDDLASEQARKFCEKALRIAEEAYRALINLSGNEVIAQQLAIERILKKLLDVIISRESKTADLACMLLANISKSEATFNLVHAAAAIKLDDDDEKGLHNPLSLLVNAFAQSREHNPRADFHYLASVFANFTQFENARLAFTDEQHPLLQHILPSANSPNTVRRFGALSTIKNCGFQTNRHDWMLSELNIIRVLIVPLALPTDFDAEELSNAPEYLRNLPHDKKRESDVELQHLLLESLLLMATTRAGRDLMRSSQVYPVIRAWHKEGVEENVDEVIQALVNLIMRDEDDSHRQHKPKDDTITIVE